MPFDELRRQHIREIRTTLQPAWLTVENCGPTIPEYEIGGPFEPFRRLAASDRLSGSQDGPVRRGAGMGLCAPTG